MNRHIFKYTALGCLAAAVSLSSCEDFLDRPAEDSYVTSDYFSNDSECEAAVNTLYASPWNDYLRGFFKVGDVLAGNFYMGTDNTFWNHTINAGDGSISEVSTSCWAVIGHANATMSYISKSDGATDEGKNRLLGECMVMKSMAYFYLVRSLGEIPIIHDINKIIEDGSAFQQSKASETDVYDYIINTLVEARRLLESTKKNDGSNGRIDYWSATGLLSKVYLTAAGISGSLKTGLLEKARDYAKEVIDNTPRKLMEDYYDIFRYSTGNKCGEGLITLHWQVSAARWTINNWMQPDLVSANFSGTGSGWGQYGGPSIDLQRLFGVKASNPKSIEETSYAYVRDASKIRTKKAGEDAVAAVVKKNNVDVRRQATMMMYGDYYQYWWRNRGGFIATWDNKHNVCTAKEDESYDAAGAEFESPTGAMCVKYVHGNSDDHVAETGVPASGMCASTQTHLLRLTDIYFVYTEATLHLGALDRTYLDKILDLRHADKPNDVTFEWLMQERRREFAFEGDNWFDFVRLSYYNQPLAEEWIKAQERGYYGATSLKTIYDTDGAVNANGGTEATESSLDSYLQTDVAQQGGHFAVSNIVQNANNKKFRIPYPQADLTANPALLGDAQPYDWAQVDYYNSANFADLNK